MNTIVLNKVDKIIELCKKTDVKRFFAFGSVVNLNFNKNSDLDFLISFNENISIEKYSENYFLLHDKLRELFNREIDLVTEKSLVNPYLIEHINASKQLIYEAQD